MRRPEFTLYDLLLNSTERHPECTAVRDDRSWYSYEIFWRQAAALARALREYGLCRGDRVGIYLEKRWEAVVSIFAIAQVGGVFVTINPLLKEAQVNHIMQDCDIKMLIGETRKLQALTLPSVKATFYYGEPAPTQAWCGETVSLSSILSDRTAGFTGNEAIETDLATIIYTSGSTGLPKGIMVSHRNLVAGAQIVSTYLENRPEDRILSVLPFSFDYGLNQLTTLVRVGGMIVLQRSLLPGDILRNLRQVAITGLAGVPSMWALLLQSRESLQQEPLLYLRYITNSGGTIPTVYLQQLQELLPKTKIYLMYGLTEAFRSTYLPPEEIYRGPTCIGKAIPNTEVWVLNEEGQLCSSGEVGELVHRGPTVTLGYWGDEEKTRSVFRSNPFASPKQGQQERVVYSGDLVKKDEEGFVYFQGRRDELIKSAGYRVSPQEVENLLCSIPGVWEAASFGKEDDVLGQRVVAIISLDPRAEWTAEEIQTACRQKAPPYLVPAIIHILRELPKTPTGKIDRAFLRNEHIKGKH